MIIQIFANLTRIMPSRTDRRSDQEIEGSAKERRGEIEDILQVARGGWEKGVGEEETGVGCKFSRIFADEFDRFYNKETEGLIDGRASDAERLAEDRAVQETDEYIVQQSLSIPVNWLNDGFQ